MTGAPDDLDLLAANDPGTPPQQLADIASRRYDLHALIAVHPQAYPELRGWIEQMQPGGGPARSVAQPVTVTPPYAAGVYAGAGYEGAGYAGATYGAPRRPRRKGIGWLFAGCGCLAVVAVIAAIAAIGGIGAATVSREDSAPVAPAAEDQAVAEQLAIYDAERAKYHELLGELDGNPVAPLVTDQDFMERIDREAAVPNISEIAARGVAQQAREFREELQAQVTAAQERRADSSGTLTEQLVDQAGDGFIDVRWDAATVCGDTEQGKVNTGCVLGGHPLVIHLQAESEASGDWERRMVVAHELAHVYQHADARRFEDGKGDADRLIEQGLFQGSDEKMADCYALTYYDQRSLSDGKVNLGYGYVCNASERQAIRTWAADVNAPMPG